MPFLLCSTIIYDKCPTSVASADSRLCALGGIATTSWGSRGINPMWCVDEAMPRDMCTTLNTAVGHHQQAWLNVPLFRMSSGGDDGKEDCSTP